jgi:hypothetical protein
MDADRVVAELERLEHEWMRAVRDRDLAFLDALLAEEFTLTTGRRGTEVRGRREWLDITRERYVIEEFSFSELEVLPLGDARWSGRGTASAGGWTIRTARRSS